MTMMEFFGCGLLAFGPAIAMFVFTVARDPLRIIVFVASAFFWLLSLLISAAWWKAVVPLQQHVEFGLVFSVIFQEIFRLLFFLLLKKAEEGLARVWKDQAEGGPVSLVSNKGLMAYVSGFGFGSISGAFSLINVLADMTGPGTVGIRGHSLYFFITSSLLTLCFILLHTLWGILFFDGLRKKRYYQPAIVFFSHMLISCLTLLNRGMTPVYPASLVPAYLVLGAMAIWTFVVVGGTCQTIRTAVIPTATSYSL